MKQKPRVKGGRSGVRDWIHSHICSDSKADRLGEELRDAHTGLSPKAERREMPWVQGSDSFRTPWTAAHQVFLSITNSWSLLKFMSIASVMLSNQLGWEG